MSRNLSESRRLGSDTIGQFQMLPATSGDAVRALAAIYVDPNDPTKRGPKEFAARLNPNSDRAQARYLACTDAGAREEFGPDEWRAIFRIGHEQGFHSVADFMLGGLYKLTPVHPEEQESELQRDFVRAVGLVEQIAARIERLHVERRR